MIKKIRWIVVSFFIFTVNFSAIHALCLPEPYIDATFYCDQSGCQEGYVWQEEYIGCCSSIIMGAEPASTDVLQSVEKQLLAQSSITPGLYDRLQGPYEGDQFTFRQGDSKSLSTQLIAYEKAYAAHQRSEKFASVIETILLFISSTFGLSFLIALWLFVLYYLYQKRNSLSKKKKRATVLALFIYPIIVFLFWQIYSNFFFIEIIC